MWPRVDLHKPKMLILNFPKKLIIQLPASNVWKNANHTIFIQFQKTSEKSFNLVSPAIWTKYNSLGMKNNVYFCLKKNDYHTISIYEKCLTVLKSSNFFLCLDQKQWWATFFKCSSKITTGKYVRFERFERFFLDNYARNLASKWAVWAVFERFI